MGTEVLLDVFSVIEAHWTALDSKDGRSCGSVAQHRNMPSIYPAR